MPDVFISYSRSDSLFVGELADGLRQNGKDVWVDIEGIRDAEVFPEALRSAIGSSDGFIFIISPASVSSAYCMREINDAVDTGKRIVPIDLEQVPADDVPEAVRVRNWIPSGGGLDATVERVVKALDTDLDHLKAHTHWELRALEWSHKDHERSLLLRGAELSEAEVWLRGAEAKEPPPTPLQREYLVAGGQAAAVRQRRVATVAVAVAVMSVALLVFALVQRGQAQSARTTNESRAVALASQAQDTVDPERALLMAVAAAKLRATPDATFALRSALDADPLLRRLPSFGGQNCTQPAPGVSFSADEILAVGLCNGRVLLFSSKGRAINSILQPDPAAPLRFDPDGSALAVAGNGKIRLYDPRSLDWRGELKVPGYPQRIVYSGNGDRLAATSTTPFRSYTSVWNARTGRLLMRRSTPAPTNGISPLVRGIGFIDNGDALAVGSPTEAVKIFASGGGRLLRTLPDKEDALLGFDPEGRDLAVAGYHTRGPHSKEGVVTLWDTLTWKPRVVAAAPGLRPRNLYVSPDASRVAVGWSDGSAAVYSLGLNAQLARFLGPTKPVSALAYSPDSREVAVGAGDGSVRIWRAGGAEIAYTELGSRMDWDLPAVSPTAVTVVTPPNSVRTFSVPGLLPSSTWLLPLPRHARYTNAWLSPSGHVGIITRSDGRADVWNLEGERRMFSLPALPGALAAVRGDDTRMILLDGEHNELVDLRTGAITPIRQRARFCRGQWQGARFSADGSRVVGGSSCAEVLEWNARTGRLLRRYALPGQITGFALSHDDRTLATASPEGRVTLLDLARGSRRSIPAAPRGIDSLDFGAGDRTLVAGVTDGTVKIWDLSNGRLLREVPLHAAATARFTPDGSKLVTAQQTGALDVYDACPGCGNAAALLREAKRRVTRKLTREERRTYLSGF